MDIIQEANNAQFRFRVSAVMIRDNKILVMRDDDYSVYYLPGGKVKFGETAEQSVLRELKEEIHIEAQIIRPLWVNQNFFTKFGSNTKVHELCIYFLVNTKLPANKETFACKENEHRHFFEWVEFSELEKRRIFPAFLRKSIYQLPDELVMIAEKEGGQYERR